MYSVLRHLAASACAIGLALATLPAGHAAAPPDPLRRHGFELPAKPRYDETLYVCKRQEMPNCYPAPSAALRAAPADNVRIVVFCGLYERDAARLIGRRNLVIEGVPCADGKLPVLDAQGAQEMGMGPYPWFDPTSSWALWVEMLELRGARVGDGSGAPFRIAGAGPAVFRNVVFRENQNGIVVEEGFEGTLYVIDSVFRDGGQSRAAETAHIYNGCRNGCTTVVLDSYFGRLVRGGNHIRFRGNIIAVGNMFIDEPGSRASRMISASDEACRIRGEDSEPPCLIARNYMLKSKESESAQFITMGDPGAGPADRSGLLVRDNVALGLRFPSIFIGDLHAKTRLVLRNNVLVIQDRKIWCTDQIDCLLAYRRAQTIESDNIVSDDPGVLPRQFPNLRGLGPGR